MVDKQILVMGSKEQDLVVVTKTGHFVFVRDENFFLEKDKIHSIVPVNSTDFDNYLESSERLKYMQKYMEKREKIK